MVTGLWCGMFPVFPVFPVFPGFPIAHLLNCLFVIKITISSLSSLSSYYNSASLRYLKVNTFPLSPLFNLGCHRGEDMVIKRRGRHLLVGLAGRAADLKNIKSHRKLNIGSLSITPAPQTDWEGEFEN